jgi:membrane-associated phospholipid phosphatase
VLTRRLVVLAILSVAFVALTVAVTGGALASLDKGVLQAMSGQWRESLHPLAQAIAELGGLELTSLLMVGLVFYLLRGGFGADAWVALAFAGAVALEALYKANMFHPGPSRAVSHADGPSLTELFGTTSALHGNSFPSGHMVRTVVVYGLLAFVVRRLAPWRLARALAVPVAIAIIALMAFDRLYLDVHWESDVLGGLLLGAIALLGATVWLDRPRRPEN